jgi:hypothetical protein
MRLFESFGSTPYLAILVATTAGDLRPGLLVLFRALGGSCQDAGDLCKQPEEEDDLKGFVVICSFVRGLRANCLFVLCSPF